MLNKIEMQQIVDKIKYKDWDIKIKTDNDRPYLQVYFKGYDKFKDEVVLQSGRKWFLSPHMCKSEVVQTAFKAVLTAEEHEAREAFLYKGKAIFGPHFDVDVLADISTSENLDYRRTETRDEFELRMMKKGIDIHGGY